MSVETNNTPPADLRRKAREYLEKEEPFAATETMRAIIRMEGFAQSLLSAAQAEHEAEVETIKATVVSTIGGEVEGHPTSTVNYLQRLRELVIKEEMLDKHDDELVEHQRRITSLESQLAEARTQIETAIDTLDGNHKPVDWRTSDAPELLRKLAEALEARAESAQKWRPKEESK